MEGRRFQSYKNKGNTTEELRKRREEEGVQLRKNKRNEMLQKRRLCADSDTPAAQTPPTSNLVRFIIYHTFLVLVFRLTRFYFRIFQKWFSKLLVMIQDYS